MTLRVLYPDLYQSEIFSIIVKAGNVNIQRPIYFWIVCKIYPWCPPQWSKTEDIFDKLSPNPCLPWFLVAKQNVYPTVTETACKDKLMFMNFWGNLMRVQEGSPWGSLYCDIQCRLNTDDKKIWGQKYWIYSVSITAFSQQMDTVCISYSPGENILCDPWTKAILMLKETKDQIKEVYVIVLVTSPSFSGLNFSALAENLSLGCLYVVKT